MIRTLLVANRGEIARRVIRSAREMDIVTVAVFSDSDTDAPHVREADRAVLLPGSSPAETYLRADLLVDAALATGCGAVHPGYGFLSENAGFARACADAGLIFVGPTPGVIESMGSKVTAKQLMAEAGVPVLPGLTVEDAAAVDDALVARAEREIGLPVLVKAAYGGGGRGMRVVHDSGELQAAVASATREAASAFGDGTVFLEHYVESPRHIEVQILADTHGHIVHLFERECSIQRRYQKVLEEAPSPAVDDALRAELGRSAVEAARAVGYVGAGTVEFVMAPDGGYYFLEMNTRLQVEHPVTEATVRIDGQGLDLVRLQLMVAEGRELPPAVHEATISGHAIEARLYAEDPAHDYRPSTGRLHRFDVPLLDGVRVDAGYESGQEVTHHYDPMLAKVVAHAATRDEARRLLARALADARIHGPVTNRDLLVGVLREQEYAAGAIDTGYLDRHDPAGFGSEVDRSVPMLAAALAGQAGRRRDAAVLADLPSGWRNVPSQDQVAVFAGDPEPLEVRYALTGRQVRASVGGHDLGDVIAHSVTPELVDLTVAGVRQAWDVAVAGDTWFVDGLGGVTLTELPRFPDPQAQVAAGSLVAPMPGTVVRVAAKTGDQVTAGAAVVVLEAMKMEHTVHAPAAGVVIELDVEVGQSVDQGTVLAVVEPPQEETA